MKQRAISLALQGGGSYGAFTWGVLDRLLEDASIDIKGVSGASAGAINATLLAHGLTVGGRQGARRALAEFWASVAGTLPNSIVESLVFLTRFFSPAQFNPFNLNPVRDLLARQIDFERLRVACELPIFISATNVRTGMPRLFRTAEITADVLLASACLPSMHRTVEIDGEAYWDGGLSANPPVRPLLYECDTADIVLVLLHPDRRPKVPVSAEEIAARWTELSFSAALFSELDGISLAKQEAERSTGLGGRLERRLRRLNLHRICAPEAINGMSMHSRLNTQSAFMGALHDAGRAQADAWLREPGKFTGDGKIEQGVAAPARQ